MPRVDDPAPPKSGPGCAMDQGIAKRRRKKGLQRVSHHDSRILEYTSFEFHHDGDDEIPETKPVINLVTAKKNGKKRKTPHLSEDSSDEGALRATSKPYQISTMETKSIKKKRNPQVPRDPQAEKSRASNATNKNQQNKKGSNNAQGPSRKFPSTTTKQTTICTTMTPSGAPLNRSVTVTVPKPTVLQSQSPRMLPLNTSNAAAEYSYHQIPPNRTAIAFDTRFLDTLEGRKTGLKILNEFELFLEALDSRGALPQILISSIPKKPRNARAKATVDPQTFQWKNGSYRADRCYHNDGIPPVWIGSSPGKNDVNPKAVNIPKALLAYESWKHFGETIEAAVEEDSKATKAMTGRKKAPPLNVTIVTSDVSMFLDAREGSHQRGLGRFWDLVKPFYEDGTIGKIDLVVAKTGVVAMVPLMDFDTHDVVAEKEADKERQADTAAYGSDARTERETEASNFHELSITKCVRALRAQTVSKAPSDARCYSQRKNVPSVEISVSLFDAMGPVRRLGFKSLLRRCLRDIVESVSSSLPQTNATDSTVQASKSNCIQLNFPETVDGTQCSVIMEIRYRTVPFALNRPVTTNAFFWDLELLSKSKLELVRQVPLSSVDASLLYGVPMEVRAGLLDDIQQYQEAVVLVRSIFRTMQYRQVGLILQIADLENEEDYDTVHNSIFHNSRRAQTFVLMANETLSTGTSSLSTGVLYRLANADESLLEPENPRGAIDTSDVSEALARQYETYVENAIDLLDSGFHNPLYLDAKAGSTSVPRQALTLSHNSSETENPWNDDTGVGALAATGSDSDALSYGSCYNSVTFEYN